MVPDESGGMIDAGRCFECKIEIDMKNAVADPNGNPLCRDCFNVLVKMGWKNEDAGDLI